ncbi:MAG: exodeoxyribonuclease VII large subunit [Clostridia bacterium]|nr:exodeoxyribonuclease VII large subunit [Clostridia bacterium]
MGVFDENFGTPEKQGDGAITVTQLNEYIKSKIDGDAFLSRVTVKGEISNFTNHYKTGHFYFTIKDEGSLIKAVMFRSAASKINFVPENGMKIVARGRVSAFVRDGQYQLYCDAMEPDGIGALYFAFEQLKKKLSAEGLFDEARKKPLPKIPTRIGVITSPTGAAIRDIINILGRRFPYAKVILYPALVQGAEAAPSLIAGMNYFNEQRNVDVIIIGRGGGSIEDLWAFNDETLARTVAASAIPTISAVGHETDFTICDFVADRRAPTPSAAAELAVPETHELMHKIDNIIGRMSLLLSRRIESGRQILDFYKTQGIFAYPERMFEDRKMQLLMLGQRLETSMNTKLTADRALLAQRTAKLEALSPLGILSRGYSVAAGADGKVISSVNDVSKGDTFTLRLSDGTLDATVN